MENKLKYFLVVAEELNISRAAKRLFITQQSLSNHIKRLEEIYQTKLFYRKPRVSLTPAGEMLASTLGQIRVLEEGLANRLNSMMQEYRGTLHIGISHSRAGVIMPHIIPSYKAIYPNIEIILEYNNTIENLENRLVRGYLDLFIGVSRINNDSIGIVPLRDEKIFVVLSDNLVRKYIPPGAIDEFGNIKDDTDLSVFCEIPFIVNTADELSYKIYSQYFESRGITLRSILRCDDSYLRTSMCARDMGACIVVELMLRHVHRHNALHGREGLLRAFALPDLKIPSILAYHKGMFMTDYAREFVRLVADETSLCYETPNP